MFMFCTLELITHIKNQLKRSDQWSVKVERDENYVWIYYSSNFRDLPFLFTFAYTMMIKIYVTI